MINGTIGPVCMKIFLDESRSFAVDRIYERFCIRAPLAFRDQAAYFVFLGSVEKSEACRHDPAESAENLGLRLRNCRRLLRPRPRALILIRYCRHRESPREIRSNCLRRIATVNRDVRISRTRAEHPRRVGIDFDAGDTSASVPQPVSGYAWARPNSKTFSPKSTLPRDQGRILVSSFRCQ